MNIPKQSLATLLQSRSAQEPPKRSREPKNRPIPADYAHAFMLLPKHARGDIVARQLTKTLYIRNYSSFDAIALINSDTNKVIVQFNADGTKE